MKVFRNDAEGVRRNFATKETRSTGLYSCILWNYVSENQKRGREYEQLEQDPELYSYYKELNRRYEEWYEQFDICPKIVIDGDKYDFVADPACGEQIVQEIKMRAKKMTEEADAQSIRYTTNNPKAKGIFTTK